MHEPLTLNKTVALIGTIFFGMSFGIETYSTQWSLASGVGGITFLMLAWIWAFNE